MMQSRLDYLEWKMSESELTYQEQKEYHKLLLIINEGEENE